VKRTRVLALLFASATVATAQAPKITAAGDPSVNADTIYRLAVDAAKYPEETSRFLLDDGVIRVEADGRGTKTYRQIVQILRAEAVEDYQEFQFSYAPKHEKFTLNWIKVVRPDGSVISDKPTQVQESDVPAQMGDPVYSDRKVIRVSITGVAAGTIVDWSTTTEELKPFLDGDWFSSWSVSTGGAVGRSRYIVDAPASLKLNIKEENLNFKRVETVNAGRRTMTWATRDLEKVKREMFASDSNGVFMSVLFSLPVTWGDIGKWYAGNARGRYTLTPELESKLKEIVAPARTLDDSLRAVHRWVAQDVRYVSIALGLGGYQPRTPAEVLSSGFGDCKDKATIFVAMLQKMGMTAHPVLLNSTGGVEVGLPSITQFDHAIAAFKRPGRASYEFTDLTASLTPFGELPFGPQGEFGIVVLPDGRVEEVTFPMSRVADNRLHFSLVGTIGADGNFTGTYEESGFGNLQYRLRGVFENPMDSAQKAQLANGVARRYFPGATGTDLVGFEGKDLRAPSTMKVRVNGRAVQLSGTTAILRNPVGSSARLGTLADEVDKQIPRQFPIDAEGIFGYNQLSAEFRFTLPEGWLADLPAGVDASGPFGFYRSTYKQQGRELRITREFGGAKGLHAPDKVKDLSAWLRAIGKDDAEVILIRQVRQ
jgi:hypothetical protein